MPTANPLLDGFNDSPSSVDYNSNVDNYLEFLNKAEGSPKSNTIVGGGKFDDYSKHPGVVGITTKEGPSTAAGKWQITKTTYDDIAPKIGVTDFSEESQKKIALKLIQDKGALEDIQKGDYKTANEKLGGVWASLPSSPYSQSKRSPEWVEGNLKATMVAENAITKADEAQPSQVIDRPSSSSNPLLDGFKEEDQSETNPLLAGFNKPTKSRTKTSSYPGYVPFEGGPAENIDAVKAFTKSGIATAAKFIPALPAMTMGSQALGVAGTMAGGPVLGVAGAIVGGVGGLIAGEKAVEKLYDEFMPEKFKEFTGYDTKTREAEIAANPDASRYGQYGGSTVLFRPGFLKPIVLSSGKKIGTYTQRAIMGVAGGAFEAGSELASGEKLSAKKIKEAAIFSAVAATPTALTTRFDKMAADIMKKFKLPTLEEAMSARTQPKPEAEFKLPDEPMPQDVANPAEAEARSGQVFTPEQEVSLPNLKKPIEAIRVSLNELTKNIRASKIWRATLEQLMPDVRNREHVTFALEGQKKYDVLVNEEAKRQKLYGDDDVIIAAKEARAERRKLLRLPRSIADRIDRGMIGARNVYRMMIKEAIPSEGTVKSSVEEIPSRITNHQKSLDSSLDYAKQLENELYILTQEEDISNWKLTETRKAEFGNEAYKEYTNHYADDAIREVNGKFTFFDTLTGGAVGKEFNSLKELLDGKYTEDFLKEGQRLYLQEQVENNKKNYIELLKKGEKISKSEKTTLKIGSIADLSGIKRYNARIAAKQNPNTFTGFDRAWHNYTKSKGFPKEFPPEVQLEFLKQHEYRLSKVIERIESRPHDTPNTFKAMELAKKEFKRLDILARVEGNYEKTRQNYVTHAFNFKGSKVNRADQIKLTDLIFRNTNPRFFRDFSKARTIRFLRDLEAKLHQAGSALGIDTRGVIVEKDIAKVMQIYKDSMGQAIIEKRLVNYLTKIKMTGDRLVGSFKELPIITKDPQLAFNANYVSFTGPGSEALKGYKVHPDFVGPLGFMFLQKEPGAISKAFDSISMLAKTIQVSLSAFHATSLFISRSTAAPDLMLKDIFKAGAGSRLALEEFERNGASDTVRRALDSGLGIKSEDIKLAAVEKLGQGVDNFINTHIITPLSKKLGKNVSGVKLLSRVTDPLQERYLRHLDRFTWDYMHTMGKLQLWQHFVTNITTRHPEIPSHIIEREVAKFVDNTLGGLNWLDIANSTQNKMLKDGLFWLLKKENRFLANAAFFAPDWTLSTIRAFSTGLPKQLLKPQNWELRQGLKGLSDPTSHADLARRYALFTMIAWATLYNGIQYAITGKSIFDNKDPTRLDLGDGTTMQAAKHSMEVVHWTQHFWKTLFHKLAYVPKTAVDIYKDPNKDWSNVAAHIVKPFRPFSVSAAIDAPIGDSLKRGVASTIGLPILGQTNKANTSPEVLMERKRQKKETLRANKIKKIEDAN